MFYEAEEIDKSLVCSYCQERFTSIVKLIPDCENLICGDCSDAIQVDDTNRFKCEACKGAVHTMSTNGFPLLKTLMSLIRSRPIPKSLNETTQRLKSSIEDTQDLIDRLKSFDRTEEINSYCDQLDSEVAEAAESEINHLRNLQEQHASEISVYRQELLGQTPTQPAISDTSESSNADDTEDPLAALSDQANELSRKWSPLFKRIDTTADDDELKLAQGEVDDCRTKAQDIERDLRTKAFNSRVMVFKRNYLFHESKDYVGKLDLVVCEQEKKDSNLACTVNTRIDINVENARFMMFLPNEKLAVCSGESIRIWNHTSREFVMELLPKSGTIYSLALLPNGFLASGGEDSCVKIWDLVERKLVKSLTGHKSVVVSLAALKNGNLASCSVDDTIKIWNPVIKDDDNLIFTLHGHGISQYSYYATNLELISNGDLVTCSNSPNEISVIKRWDTMEGKRKATFSTNQTDAITSKVLNNDRVAVSYLDRKIRVFDLFNRIQTQSIDLADNVYSFQVLPNGCIVTGDTQFYDKATYRNIELRNLADGKRIQTAKTKHQGYISSIAVTRDGKLLAIGSSADKFIQLFSVAAQAE